MFSRWEVVSKKNIMQRKLEPELDEAIVTEHAASVKGFQVAVLCPPTPLLGTRPLAHCHELRQKHKKWKSSEGLGWRNVPFFNPREYIHEPTSR